VVIPRNCIGCRTCEVACSFAHAVAGHDGGQLGHSRIRVHAIAPQRFVQVTCLQCANAACVKVCPTSALVRNPITSAIEVNEQRCIGCSLCRAACPFGHMHFDRPHNLAVKCDLCKGQPACAKFCPNRALAWR
jgi:carbon-monoxide dehydrogenase iron sulfur subunit